MASIETIKIHSDPLLKNYFTIVDHPFSDWGLTLTMYKVCQSLREEEFDSEIGFYGEPFPDLSQPEWTRERFRSPDINQDFSYWAGHGFLWQVAEDNQEGIVWFMPEEKRQGFVKDLDYINKNYPPSVVELLRDTIASSATEAHQVSKCSHPKFQEYFETWLHLKDLRQEIFPRSSSRFSS